MDFTAFTPTKFPDIEYISGTFQPSPYVSLAKKKEPKWIMANIMYHYSIWNGLDETAGGYYDRYTLNDLFSEGRQPRWLYLPAFDVIKMDDASANALFRDDFTPSAIIPKRVNFMIDMVMDSFGKLKATAQDPWSDMERNAEKADMMLEIAHGEELRGLLSAANIQPPPPPPENAPQTFEELEIYNAFGGTRLQCEMDAQKIIRFLEALNDMPELRYMTCRDIINNHIGVYATEVMPGNKKVKISHVHPRNAMLPPTAYNDYRDMQWGGWFESVDRSQFIEMAQDQLSPAEIEDIFKTYGGMHQFVGAIDGMDQYYDMGATNNQPFRYYNKINNDLKDRIIVLHGWNYSPIFQSYKSYTNKSGKENVKKVDFEEDLKEQEKRKKEKENDEVFNGDTANQELLSGSKIKSTSKKGVFKGTWVVGSKVIINAKMDTYQKRKQNSLYDTPPPMAAFRLSDKSPVELMRPADMDFNIARFCKNNLFARSGPPIIAFSEDGIVTGDVGQGKSLSPSQTVTAALQSGVLSLKATNDNDMPVPVSSVIQIFDRQISNQVQAYALEMDRATQLINELSGFNDVTAGGTVNPKTGKKVAEQMSLATMRAIKPILRALQHLEVDIMTTAVGKAQMVLEEQDLEAYSNILGKTTTIRISKTPGMAYRDIGVDLVPEWSDDEKQEFEEALMLEIQRGTLDGVDKLMIKKSPDTDVMMRVMMLIRKKKQEQAQKQQEGMMAQQAQQNAQLQQEGAQLKMQTEQLKGQIKDAQLQRMQLARDRSAEQEHKRQLEMAMVEGELNAKILQLESELSRKTEEILALLEGKIKSRQIFEQGTQLVRVEEAKPTPKPVSRPASR